VRTLKKLCLQQGGNRMNFSSLLKLRRFAAVASLFMGCLVATTARADVVLLVDSNGVLTGATGITVGSLAGTYSVEFRDGSCISLFGGCVSTSFDFTDINVAGDAARALSDSVFTGVFDTQQTRTFGCPGPATGELQACSIYTPFELFDSGSDTGVMSAVFINRELESGDGVTYSELTKTFDTGINGGAVVYAVWSRESSVPEPGTLGLLGLAGAALAWSQRRRRISTQ
jgi:hypothetical protein